MGVSKKHSRKTKKSKKSDKQRQQEILSSASCSSESTQDTLMSDVRKSAKRATNVTESNVSPPEKKKRSNFQSGPQIKFNPGVIQPSKPRYQYSSTKKCLVKLSPGGGVIEEIPLDKIEGLQKNNFEEQTPKTEAASDLMEANKVSSNPLFQFQDESPQSPTESQALKILGNSKQATPEKGTSSMAPFNITENQLYDDQIRESIDQKQNSQDQGHYTQAVLSPVKQEASERQAISHQSQKGSQISKTATSHQFQSQNPDQRAETSRATSHMTQNEPCKTRESSTNLQNQEQKEGNEPEQVLPSRQQQWASDTGYLAEDEFEAIPGMEDFEDPDFTAKHQAHEFLKSCFSAEQSHNPSPFAHISSEQNTHSALEQPSLTRFRKTESMRKHEKSVRDELMDCPGLEDYSDDEHDDIVGHSDSPVANEQLQVTENVEPQPQQVGLESNDNLLDQVNQDNVQEHKEQLLENTQPEITVLENQAAEQAQMDTPKPVQPESPLKELGKAEQEVGEQLLVSEYGGSTGKLEAKNEIDGPSKIFATSPLDGASIEDLYTQDPDTPKPPIPGSRPLIDQETLKKNQEQRDKELAEKRKMEEQKLLQSIDKDTPGFEQGTPKLERDERTRQLIAENFKKAQHERQLKANEMKLQEQQKAILQQQQQMALLAHHSSSYAEQFYHPYTAYMDQYTLQQYQMQQYQLQQYQQQQQAYQQATFGTYDQYWYNQGVHLQQGTSNLQDYYYDTSAMQQVGAYPQQMYYDYGQLDTTPKHQGIQQQSCYESPGQQPPGMTYQGSPQMGPQ